MLYKTLREQSEFNELATHNPKLFKICIMGDQFCQLEFGKELTITSVLRTQQEQDALYQNVPLEQRPKSSPHLVWQGVDFRSRDLSSREKERITEFLNQFIVYGGQRKCCFIHAIDGNVEHAHIQCDNKA